jgi:site-specific DNA-methyltransferase (adenine-specific)
MGERIQLHQGDCFDLLETLPDNSIDYVCTDPPFGNTCCGWDHKFDLAKWWEIIERKLKPTGIVTAFCCGRFTFELYASKPEWFRYDLVWEKSMAVGFLDARRKPMRAHEMILMFAPKLKDSTYNPQKWVNDKAVIGQKRIQASATTLYDKHCERPVWTDDGTRFPRSVIHFDSISNSSKEKTKHSTQKPLDLMQWLIKTYSNEDDLVVDPFFGSGTTAEACLLTKRRFWGCDLSHDYLAMAQKRISQRECVLPSIC